MIIANWKMNGSKELIEVWLNFVSKNIKIIDGKDCIFCPPSCYIDFSKRLVEKTNQSIRLGSQELDSLLSKPLTGGITAEMLEEVGCSFVIIGHSEQRIHLKESNELLSNKLVSAIENKLTPIYCVGETAKQKKSNQTKEVLLEQLDVIQSQIIDKCIIAYEPVWAIGTGESAEISYIEEVHSFIKEELKNTNEFSKEISVVYGGSVNLENYKETYNSSHVDGLLIGGASLNHSTFTKIYNMS